MIRTKETWQEYLEKNINMKHGMQVRGYVAGDDLDHFVDNGIFLVNRVKQDANVKTFSGLKILDIGCANGRFPVGLDVLGYEPKQYVGTDVVRNAIRLCKAAFKGNSRYEFHHVNVRNTRYSLLQPGNIKEVELPGEDYDLIVANSVWTHLGHPDNAQAYLNKVATVLSEEGVAYITWFKSPPNTVNFGEKRSVYHALTIKNMYERAGLEIVAEYSGNTTSNKDQWRLISRKK